MLSQRLEYAYPTYPDKIDLDYICKVVPPSYVLLLCYCNPSNCSYFIILKPSSGSYVGPAQERPKLMVSRCSLASLRIASEKPPECDFYRSMGEVGNFLQLVDAIYVYWKIIKIYQKTIPLYHLYLVFFYVHTQMILNPRFAHDIKILHETFSEIFSCWVGQFKRQRFSKKKVLTNHT